MPAVPAFLVHGSGVTINDVGVKDEDYLLIHSVDDDARYAQEITRNNLSGKRVYTAYVDPVLTYNIEGHCLAFQGLANYHPGISLSSSLLNNHLSNNFGWTNGILVYKRARRRRVSADLASCNFEIEVVNPVIEIPDIPYPVPPEIEDPVEPPPDQTPGLYWRRQWFEDITEEGVTAPVAGKSYVDVVFEEDSNFPDDIEEFRGGSGAIYPYPDTSDSALVEVYRVLINGHWLLLDEEGVEDLVGKIVAWGRDPLAPPSQGGCNDAGTLVFFKDDDDNVDYEFFRERFNDIWTLLDAHYGGNNPSVDPVNGRRRTILHVWSLATGVKIYDHTTV